MVARRKELGRNEISEHRIKHKFTKPQPTFLTLKTSPPPSRGSSCLNYANSPLLISLEIQVESVWDNFPFLSINGKGLLQCPHMLRPLPGLSPLVSVFMPALYQDYLPMLLWKFCFIVKNSVRIEL